MDEVDYDLSYPEGTELRMVKYLPEAPEKEET